MSDVEKNLDVHIRAKDEASNVFNSAFENIKRKSKELNQEARASGDTALERMLKGGGALGIVTLAGEALKKVTTEAVKLSEELEKGKINAADVALEIGKSLPVLGGFVEAGESINELFTHQKSDIEHINEDIKAGNELMTLRVKQQHEAVKAEEDLADRARKAADALHLALAKPEDKQAVAGANRLDDINAELKKDKKGNEERIRKDSEEEIKAIRAAHDAAKKTAQDVARDNFSVSHIHSDSENEEMLQEQLRAATFKVDAIFDRQVRDAQAKAKAEIARTNGELDSTAGDRKKTVRADSASESAKQDVEKAKKHLEGWAHTANELIEKALTPRKPDQLARDTADAVARAKEEQLRISGHALEADLVQLQAAHEKRLEEIKRAAQEEVAARPAEAKKIRAQESGSISAEEDSYQGSVGQAKSTAAIEEAKKHGDIQRQIHQGKIEMLEKEAALGNLEAGREAERLKIADEYAKRKAEILKFSQGASEADKAALKTELSQLDAQQRKSTILAALKPQIEELMAPTRYAGFEDFRKTQGIMAAQRERDSSKSQEQLQHLQAIVEATNNISAKLDPLVQWAGQDSGDGSDSNLD